MRTCFILLSLLLQFVFINLLLAQNKITATDGDWHSAATWSPPGVPFAEDTIIVNHDVTFSQDIVIQEVTELFKINAGKTLFNVNTPDSLIVPCWNFIVDGELRAAFIAEGTITATVNNGTIIVNYSYATASPYTNNGYIEVGERFMQSDDFTNKSNAMILADSMITSGSFTNEANAVVVVNYDLITSGTLVNNGDISCDNWTNAANVSGTTGKFCIANFFNNTSNIGGSVDICDATPNTIFDNNFGTIAGTVTNCTAGPCATSVGIKEKAAMQNSFHVYPNPAAGTFTVKGDDIIAIKVYDITGKLVLEDMPQNAFSHTVIDASVLLRGIYLLKVATATGELTCRLVISG